MNKLKWIMIGESQMETWLCVVDGKSKEIGTEKEAEDAVKRTQKCHPNVTYTAFPVMEDK